MTILLVVFILGLAVALAYLSDRVTTFIAREVTVYLACFRLHRHLRQMTDA